VGEFQRLAPPGGSSGVGLVGPGPGGPLPPPPPQVTANLRVSGTRGQEGQHQAQLFQVQVYVEQWSSRGGGGNRLVQLATN
jgi:hypothetical protein